MAAESKGTKGELQVTTPSDREIAMTRVFDAPRKMVFEAFTKPELVKRWLTGPPGWTMAVCQIDPKVNGGYRYLWRHDDGKEMGMSGVYREVAAPERIVTTEVFDNPWYPGEAVGTVTFAEREGKTTVTNTVLYETKAIRDGALKSGMEKGVAFSYDRLAALLAA